MSNWLLTPEQVVEFWKWCGFRQDMSWLRSSGIYWFYPTGEHDILPPIDMNNLFKYAVPKLKAYVLQSFGEGHKLHHASAVLDYEIKDWNGMNVYSCNVDREQDPALALFWAIWQVIQEVSDA